MESTLVSARISQAKKDAGVALLDSIGANTSELINSAFDYLLSAKQLPSVALCASRDAEGFRSFVDACSIGIDWGANAEEIDYKKILCEGRRFDYESLA